MDLALAPAGISPVRGAGFGGAIFIRTGTLNLTSTTFTNNSAVGGSGVRGLGNPGQGKGGAIFVFNGATVNAISGNSFSGSVAAEAGRDSTTTYDGAFFGPKTCPGQDNLDICGPVNGKSLIVTVVGQGSVAGSGISCPPSCNETGPSSITLTATPSGGWVLTGFSGACSGTGSCLVDLSSSNQSVTATFIQAQTITFDAPAAHTLGDADFNVAATASSGLPVTFSGGTAGVCTVNSTGGVHLTGSGQCSITANQSGNASYAAAISVTQSFTVNKTAQTITFNAPAAHTFGDSDFNVTATASSGTSTASSGLPVTFSGGTAGVCTVNSAGVVHLTGAGQCSITANQTGNASYAAAMSITQTFTVNKATQTINFANPGTQAFGTVLNLSASATSGLTVSLVSTTPGICTVSGVQVSFSGPGQCSITASQAGDGNYQAATSVTQAFSVVAPDLIISKSHVGHFSQGQTDATYTIVVSNSGNASTNGSTVTVADSLPPGLALVSIAGSGWTCATTCSRSDVLPSGMSYPTITLVVSVSANASPSLTNQVSVSGGGEANLSNDSASDPTTINPIVNLAGQVNFTQSGFTRNRATGLFVGTLTVTNTRGAAINGPVQVVLTNLTSGVTLANASGQRNGSPYITVAPGGLAPGASASVSVQFNNPSNGFINYTPVTVSGTF